MQIWQSGGEKDDPTYFLCQEPNTGDRNSLQRFREPHNTTTRENATTRMDETSSTVKPKTRLDAAKDVFNLFIFGFWALCLIMSVLAILFWKKSLIIIDENKSEEEHEYKTELEEEDDEDDDDDDGDSSDESSSSSSDDDGAVNKLVAVKSTALW
ncbi:hypothetical protein ElyMa_004753700 [Elysia marginata]|uniref:Uncharacterized protein n=1 Tax=Elysia marginata TaxID=1093978 RepID=A0AAV4ID29_9GAST|nr:hypothetical protein ElyMa_004753700 [Elysia marginata]